MIFEPLKAGDPLAPVTGTHLQGVREIDGVIFRLAYVTNLQQPIEGSLRSANFVMKPAQARALAQNLIDAANVVEGAVQQPAAVAAPKEESLADLLAGADFQIKN
jgi:hypothetical protein